jgi:hypothetical protein
VHFHTAKIFSANILSAKIFSFTVVGLNFPEKNFPCPLAQSAVVFPAQSRACHNLNFPKALPFGTECGNKYKTLIDLTLLNPNSFLQIIILPYSVPKGKAFGKFKL